jgi:hypothetical protein
VDTKASPAYADFVVEPRIHMLSPFTPKVKKAPVRG